MQGKRVGRLVGRKVRELERRFREWLALGWLNGRTPTWQPVPIPVRPLRRRGRRGHPRPSGLIQSGVGLAAPGSGCMGNFLLPLERPFGVARCVF